MNAATKILIKWTPEELERRHAARNKKVLFKQGAYLRTAMQRMMRYAKKPSNPGQPPRAHRDTKKGPLLRKLIKFDVDLREKSVACGPEKTGHNPQAVPQLLDQGGRVPLAKLLKPRAYQIGDYGPLRFLGRGEAAYGKIHSADQAARAERLIAEEDATRAAQGHATIAARPFTTPTLTGGGKKIRELVANIPL